MQLTARIPDVVAVCASDPHQAQHFRTLLDRRIDGRLYPREVAFAVTHDPADGRVGSGGGTLNALYQLEEQFGSSIKDARVLLIQAGGESRRLPTYAPEGKLFMPLPVPSSSPIPPVLLDLQLSLYMRYPWLPGELVVASGDVAIDFDTSIIPEERGDVCGFARTVPLEVGSRHGVYRLARNRRNVTGFFQKADVEFLRDHASLDDGSRCALDMGTVAFSPRAWNALCALGEAEGSDGPLGERVSHGQTGFDLYLEILSAVLPDSSLKSYLDLVASRSRLSTPELEYFHGILQELELTGVLARGARFYHFGSLSDLRQSRRAINSHPILPFYYRSQEQLELFPVPDENTDCVWDRRQLRDGTRVIAVYGTGDDWKPVSSLDKLRFCNEPMSSWLRERGLTERDVWPERPAGSPYDLYNARLFSPAFQEDFLQGFLESSRVGGGAFREQWSDSFLNTTRMTLHEINGHTDPVVREEALIEERQEELRSRILSGNGWLSVNERDFARTFSQTDVPVLRDLARKTEDDLVRVYRDRLVALLEEERESEGTFALNYLSHLTTPPKLQVSVKEDQIVWARCPVRLDLGGGWTDTPPYTLREGGAVTNVAVDLNGQPPIQVFCRALREPEIRVHSIDLGLTETYRSFEELETYGDPDTNFALPKAALALLGFSRKGTSPDGYRRVSSDGNSLHDILRGLGGGLELTLLSAVPKGSGLGTSSIIGATVLAALERFFGMYNEEYLRSGELYRQVLQMEQMLTTGGGWQDQIGGAAGGVKFIESAPGLRPDPRVYQLDPFLFEDPSLTSRMTLFYTGATRLAKNILQEVVDGFNGMTPAYLFTVRRIGSLAHSAREALATRDLDRLAAVVSESWRENKLIHPSTTNDEIDSLLARLAPHYQAVKLLGAGGGGYAFFISQSVRAAEALRRELDAYVSETGNPRARRVAFSLNKPGLEVTVS